MSASDGKHKYIKTYRMHIYDRGFILEPVDDGMLKPCQSKVLIGRGALLSFLRVIQEPSQPTNRSKLKTRKK